MAKDGPTEVRKPSTGDAQGTDRQGELQALIAEALRDPGLVEALRVYELGQAEYVRAVAGSVNVKVLTGSSTNPGDYTDADLDRD